MSETKFVLAVNDLFFLLYRGFILCMRQVRIGMYNHGRTVLIPIKRVSSFFFCCHNKRVRALTPFPIMLDLKSWVCHNRSTMYICACYILRKMKKKGLFLHQRLRQFPNHPKGLLTSIHVKSRIKKKSFLHCNHLAPHGEKKKKTRI
jgi:hypothetical protein